MFLRDINGTIVQVGDTLAYAVNGHGSTPNLGLASVDLIRWFKASDYYDYGQPPVQDRVRVRAHIIRHSSAKPGSTVWLSRIDRMVKV